MKERKKEKYNRDGMKDKRKGNGKELLKGVFWLLRFFNMERGFGINSCFCSSLEVREELLLKGDD